METTLYQPDPKWLSYTDVYPPADLVLICADGRVPVHSALLAGSSPLLSSLLLRHPTCHGCPEPLHLLLTDTPSSDCTTLLSLLYTGRAGLDGPSANHVLSLAETLGLQLPGLQVQNADASLLVCDLPKLHHRVPQHVEHLTARRGGGLSYCTVFIFPENLRTLYELSTML